jgi:hypothetical protein
MMKRLVMLAVSSLFSAAALAATPTIDNGSFETTTVGSGYWYGNAASGWSFLDGAGVTANGTAWNGAASDGAYFAFLQNTASITQTFTSTVAASYTFDFDLALRAGYAAGQVVAVSLDGVELGQYTASLGWSSTTVSAYNIGAGSHTLSFAGITTNAGDTSAFLDNVAMSVSAVPEADTYAMLLAGLGVVGFVARRRKAASPVA